MRPPGTRDTNRCVTCGEPLGDHIPMRYWLRAWLKHLVMR